MNVIDLVKRLAAVRGGDAHTILEFPDGTEIPCTEHNGEFMFRLTLMLTAEDSTTLAHISGTYFRNAVRALERNEVSARGWPYDGHYEAQHNDGDSDREQHDGSATLWPTGF